MGIGQEARGVGGATTKMANKLTNRIKPNAGQRRNKPLRGRRLNVEFRHHVIIISGIESGTHAGHVAWICAAKEHQLMSRAARKEINQNDWTLQLKSLLTSMWKMAARTSTSVVMNLFIYWILQDTMRSFQQLMAATWRVSKRLDEDPYEK